MSYISRIATNNKINLLEVLLYDYGEENLLNNKRILIVSDDHLTDKFGDFYNCSISYCNSISQAISQNFQAPFDAVFVLDGLPRSEDCCYDDIKLLLADSGIVYTVASSELSSAGQVIYRLYNGVDCSSRMSAEQIYRLLSRGFLIDTMILPVTVSFVDSSFPHEAFFETNFDLQKVRSIEKEGFLQHLESQCKNKLGEQLVIFRCFSNIDALATVRIAQHNSHQVNFWDRHCERDVMSFRSNPGTLHSYSEAVEAVAEKMLTLSSHNHNTMFSFLDEKKWFFRNEMNTFVSLLHKSKEANVPVGWQEILVALLFAAQENEQLRTFFPIFVDEDRLNVTTAASFSIQVAEENQEDGVWGTTIRLPFEFSRYPNNFPNKALMPYFNDTEKLEGILEEIRAGVIEHTQQDCTHLLTIHNAVYQKYTNDMENPHFKAVFDQAWDLYWALFDGQPSIEDKWHFCYVLYWRGLYLSGTTDAFVYYPHWSRPQNQAVFAISNFCKREYVKTYFDVYSQFGQWLDSVYLMNTVKKSQLKSAIGSIMSRNGSHNIGSHVLSALSHHVGTMPDDRVLYQYIQHRMDYIANVTTDFPVWTQPTMFLGELMKEFFSQRHLLEHIAESEGLSAWEFQNPNLSGDAAENQCGKIQIRIRCKSRNDSSYRDVLHYMPDDVGENLAGGVVDLSKDVALAIPGGVVGNHAFYTILENVIRNAAKHGWSAKKSVGTAKNLEVAIDYEEAEREVVFTIWDNMSDANCSVDDGAGKKTDLVSRQGKRIEQPFIDELSGRLRRENWGIAEFKISAGYLMGRDISDIGGVAKKSKKIVEACKAPEEDHSHLGYRFCVRKPRNVVFVLDTNEGAQKNLWDKVQSRKGALATLGIEFIRWEDAGTNDQSDLFASRYVVLPKFGMDEKDGRCPFRVLVWKAPKVSECKDLVGIVDIERVSNAVISDKTDEEVASALHRTVALAWLEHLKSQSSDVSVKDNPKFALVVNTGGSESKAGRGLITDDDLLEFVFSHGLRTAIETFCEDSGPLDEGVRDIVWVLHALPPSKPCFRKYPLKEELPAKISWNLLARLDDLKKDMGSKPEKEKLEESRKRLHFEMSPTWERMEQGIDYLTYRHGIPPKTNDASSSPPVRDALEQVRLKLKQAEYEESPHPIERFVQHLCRVFRETEVFLRKYEERIATLPAHFVWLDGKSRSEAKAKKTGRHFGFVEVYPQRTALASGMPIANYSRHDENRAPDETYHEPLSGTQSYFGALSRIFSETDQNAERGLDIVLSRLVENALLKLCVADERVAKFLREHPTMRKTYRAENILVLDDKWVEGELDSAVRSNGESQPDDHPFPKTDLDVDLEWSKVFLSLLQHSREFVRNNLAGDWEKWTTERNFDTKELRGAISRYFDILVLHQGLLDKWLGEASHSQEHVSKFLGIWKKYVKYLVITTGRGTPANIPAGARVLPFPTLESSLFCKYPEKMMLVDTIMNILPAKGGGPKGERQ